MTPATNGDPGPSDAWAATGLEVLRPRDFSPETLDRPGLYVVCFAAEWCPVTRRFMPRYLRLQVPSTARLAIADITDLESPLWDAFRIRITPSIIVFRDGKPELRVDGRRFFGIGQAELERLQHTLGGA